LKRRTKEKTFNVVCAGASLVVIWPALLASAAAIALIVSSGEDLTHSSPKK
jgi:hypothetical protein